MEEAKAKAVRPGRVDWKRWTVEIRGRWRQG